MARDVRGLSAMSRLVVAVLLVLGSSTAHAGGYLGLGIGPSPAVNDNLDSLSPSGRSGRFLAGFRFSKLAVEGAVTAYTASVGYDARQFQLTGKYNHELGSGFEVYGRFGVHHTSLDADDAMYDVSGNGLLIGGGAELRLPLPITASMFLDYSLASATLSGDRYDLEHSSRMWMLGFTIGL